MKWIKCSDRLPEPDKMVLITDGNKIETGYYGEEEYCYGWYGIDIGSDKVTYWAYLPKPPKK